MSELKVINYNNVNVIESREIAKNIGKEHKHLIRDIQGYIKVLDMSPNLDPSNFFIESTYLDTYKRNKKCYLLTKQGCEMVANKMTGKKGILFTAEYVQAFNEMKQALVEIDNTVTTKGQLTQEEWNKISKKSKYLTENIYNRKSVSNYISNYDLMHLQDVIDEVYNVVKPCKADIRYEIMDGAIKTLKSISNEYDYSNPMNTFIKDTAKDGIEKLQDLQIEKLKADKDRQNRKIKAFLKYMNEIDNYMNEVDKYNAWLTPSLSSGAFNELNVHPFSYNYIDYKNGKTYNYWRNVLFPTEQVWSKKVWEEAGVDFSRPIKIIIRNINKEEFDTDNLEKATIDKLFYSIFKLDDNIVYGKDSNNVGHCDTFEDGKIYYYLRNMTDEEINEEANKEQGDN